MTTSRSVRAAGGTASTDNAIILVGANKCSFRVDRKLLCAVSPFFRDRLERKENASNTTASGKAGNLAPSAASSMAKSSSSSSTSSSTSTCLWLPDESAAMFALFVEWVNAPYSFRGFLDQAVNTAHEKSPRALQDTHWAIVRLHLFASQLDLGRLQDLAIDLIQDLYLCFDWDVPPSVIVHLYSEAKPVPAVRIRLWAVAMVAFSLTNAPNRAGSGGPLEDDRTRFEALFKSLPAFAADYNMHVRNMTAAGLDVAVKNPQLRIAANKLHNDQRLFGFRECSFHSYRAVVGEHRCPHHIDAHRRRRISELAGGSSITIVNRDSVPRPLFSGREHSPLDRPLRHMRSIPRTIGAR